MPECAKDSMQQQLDKECLGKSKDNVVSSVVRLRKEADKRDLGDKNNALYCCPSACQNELQAVIG